MNFSPDSPGREVEAQYDLAQFPDDRLNVIARLDRTIHYSQAGGYGIVRSSRAMTAGQMST
jgi:hypothetical protein